MPVGYCVYWLPWQAWRMILKSAIYPPNNLIDRHGVDMNILDNSCFILCRI